MLEKEKKKKLKQKDGIIDIKVELIEIQNLKKQRNSTADSLVKIYGIK